MVEQEYPSAKTCLNQVPALFKQIPWVPFTTNLDIGGGKYGTGTKWLLERDVDNFIFDPYNQSLAHNIQVLQSLREMPPSTATMANLLNVIKERENRLHVLKLAAAILQPTGDAWISIYPGDKSGRGRETKPGCWQNNLLPEAYVPEMKGYFRSVTRRGQFILATESKHAGIEIDLYQYLYAGDHDESRNSLPRIYP